jgi:hypothetical protein
LAVRSLRAQGWGRSNSLRNSPGLAHVELRGESPIWWRVTDTQCQRIEPRNSRFKIRRKTGDTRQATQDRRHRTPPHLFGQAAARLVGTGRPREPPAKRVRRVGTACPSGRRFSWPLGLALASPHISQNISAITSHENGKGIRSPALAAVIRVWGVDGQDQLAQHGPLGAPAAAK